MKTPSSPDKAAIMRPWPTACRMEVLGSGGGALRRAPEVSPSAVKRAGAAGQASIPRASLIRRCLARMQMASRGKTGAFRGNGKWLGRCRTAGHVIGAVTWFRKRLIASGGRRERGPAPVAHPSVPARVCTGLLTRDPPFVFHLAGAIYDANGAAAPRRSLPKRSSRPQSFQGAPPWVAHKVARGP